MKIIKFIKTIAFLLIFACIWNAVFSVLWLEKNSVYHFYREPEDSFDIVYIGSSNVYAHFNTTLAYNEYGFTTGLLSADTQPFLFIKYLIKDAEKYQSPELYVIDIAKIINDNDYIIDAGIRKTTDMMPFSINRSKAITAALEQSNIEEDFSSYYFSFLKYHSSWKELSSNNFYVERYYKGYLFDEARTKIVSQDEFEWIGETKDLPDNNESILLDLLQYLKDSDLNVLFVIPVRTFTEEEIKYLNEATNIIVENGFEIINFCLEEDLDIDFDAELYNGQHINVYGATKFTLYFSEYLKDNYELSDHRNDSDYSSWISEYERFKERFLELTGEDFDEYFASVKN